MNTNEIKPGDIFWLKIESDFEHPNVVIEIQGDNITVCAITTNMKKANLPGNILLDLGEGNLEKNSIIDVAKVYKVGKNELGKYIGSLSDKRVKEIKAGIKFLQRSYFE